jgi:hypothetical protein
MQALARCRPRRAGGPKHVEAALATSPNPVLYTCSARGDYVTPQIAQRAQPTRSLFGVGASTSLTGARIVIGPSERLCAFTGSPTPLIPVSNDPGSLLPAMWSGFAPYE